MKRFLFLFLLVLAACAAAPQKQLSVTPPLDKVSCNVDADCICGGIDTVTGDCFVGNKQYASTSVDMTKDCPDFCSGIAAHLETKCVNQVCKNVPKEGWNKPIVETQVQNTTVAGPNPSDAHWLCEDGSWKEKPEQCFDNSCVSEDDCEMMALSGSCGQFMLAAPKTAHKLPVFYKDRCGADSCSLVDATCSTKVSPMVKNVQCDLGKCALVTNESEGTECTTADDCIPNSCCHATGCIPGPVTKPCNMMCTQGCEPGTLDCGGSCGCVHGRCSAQFAQN